MKKSKRSIQDEAGFVVVHASLPPTLLKWVVKRARDEGHRDLSLIVQRAIDCLMAKHAAQPPAV